MKPTSKIDTRFYLVQEFTKEQILRLGLVPGMTVESMFRAYKFGPCLVFVGFEDNAWHLSISHRARYPYWDEVRDAVMRFLPRNRTYAMIIPSDDEPYVNAMDNCFHVYEVGEDETIKRVRR